MHIHCTIADSSWILEGIARNLSERLSYVDYDTRPNIAADVQYYISHHAYRRRISPVEIGWFTHIEDSPESRERFFSTAGLLDHCVCHARSFEELLRVDGVQHVSTIPPGVDTQLYSPKLRIGVVGRVYGSGRKGEDLVAQMMDVEGVDWHFTGSGWPGVARLLDSVDMPSFYNSMDYILVPSSIEAGPMCVVEALACGRPVIAPPIGWIPDYPHLEYETGNAQQLRALLERLVIERKKLRESVLGTTWDEFAAQHDRLFHSLMKQHKVYSTFDFARSTEAGSPRVESPTAANFSDKSERIHLVLPGEERAARGGPSVRVPRLARHLRASGLPAYALHADTKNVFDAKLAHVFNINPVVEAAPLLARASRTVRHLVFSPIFLETRDRDFYAGRLIKIAEDPSCDSSLDLGENIREAYGNYVEEQPTEPSAWSQTVCDLLNQPDAVVYLSEGEKVRLEKLGADVRRSEVICNPVEVERWSNADPALFKRFIDREDFVLCVGRIEPRKNQLLLGAALADTDISVVFVGAPHNDDYLNLCKRWAGKNAVFVDYLPNGDELLASAYAGARCFVLPSWAEGAPIAALEAAASGTKLVLSDRSSEREYFGDFADYVDPSDLVSLREKTLKAFNSPEEEGRRNQQIEYVRSRFDYDVVAEQTAKFYKEVCSDAATSTALKTLYVDVSQNAHTRGTPTGTCRVELEVARHLLDVFDGEVKFVVWNRPIDAFVECQFHEIVDGTLDILATFQAAALRAPLAFTGDAPLDNAAFVVLGGSWIGNPQFTRLVARTTTEKNLPLCLLVHDTMQYQFDWYPAVQRQMFSSNLATLLNVATWVLGNSNCTCEDIQDFASSERLIIAPPRSLLFGQELPPIDWRDDEKSTLRDEEGYRPLELFGEYALFVSALDVRKNHSLLIKIWKDLIARGVDHGVKLIFVGRRGWSHQRIFEEIGSILGRQILVLEGVDDVQLRALYRDALFCVYPSLYEGWGLPVSESLALGKITVTSNRGSLPEVQPDAALIIDPDDYLNWRDTVASLIASPSFRARAVQRVNNSFQERSWRATAEDLVSLLLEPRRQRSRLRTAHLDQWIRPGTNGLGLCWLEGSWSHVEEWGVWTDGRSALLRFMDPQVAGRSGAQLYLSYRLYVAPGHPSSDIEIRVNGTVLSTLSPGKSARRGQLLLDVSAEILAARAFPEIEFVMEQAASPASLGTGRETRALGVGVEEVFLGELPRGDVRSLQSRTSVLREGERLSLDAEAARNWRGRIALSGWTSPDQKGIWAVRDSATLYLHVQPSLLSGDLLLALEMRGPNHDHAEGPLPVVILCEENVVADWLVQPNGCENPRRWIRVPRSIHLGRALLKFTFRTQETWTPASHNRSTDARELRIGIVGIELRSATGPKARSALKSLKEGMVDIGRSISFGEGSRGLQFLNRGWSKAELWGVWTVGPQAQLALPTAELRKGKEAPLEMIFSGRAHVDERHPELNVDLLINGSVVEKWQFSSHDVPQFTRRVKVPDGSIGDGSLTVELRVKNPTSPASLARGNDRRALGLGLESLLLDYCSEEPSKNESSRTAPFADRHSVRAVLRAVVGAGAAGYKPIKTVERASFELDTDESFVQAATFTFLCRFLNDNDDLEGRIALGRTGLVRRLIYSAEHTNRVLLPASNGHFPHCALQPMPADWVRSSLSTLQVLSPEGVTRILNARSWMSLFSAMIGDSGFRQSFLANPSDSKQEQQVQLMRQAFAQESTEALD